MRYLQRGLRKHDYKNIVTHFGKKQISICMLGAGLNYYFPSGKSTEDQNQSKPRSPVRTKDSEVCISEQGQILP